MMGIDLFVISLVILSLGFTLIGLGLKQSAFMWLAGFFYLILCIILAINTDFLAEANWIWILIGFGLLFICLVSTRAFKSKKEERQEGLIDSDLEEMQKDRQNFEDYKTAMYGHNTPTRRSEKKNKLLGL